MNEQAIQDAYKLFVEQGYGKSIDDFKKLISTNPDALNDSYNLFKSQGYAKSIDDYKGLMGVGAQSQGELVKKDYKGLMGISADIEVKKKEQPIPSEPQLATPQPTIQETSQQATPTTPQSPMALPSGDSFLESQKQLPKFETTPLKKDAFKPVESLLKNRKTIDESLAKDEYIDNIGTKALSGLTSLEKMVASIPESIVNIASLPQNAIAWATGWDIAANSDTFKKTLGISNPILDKLNEEEKRLKEKTQVFNKERYESTGIADNISKGKYGDAFELLASAIIESAPVSIAMMMGGATLAPAELAAISTAGFLESNREQLGEENPSMSEVEKNVKALGMSAAETVFSAIGTGTIGQVYKDIIKKEGVQAGSVIFKNGLIDMYKNALKKYGAPIGLLGESIEESATQITQNVLSGKPIFQGVADAFITGAGSGVVFSAPITAVNAKKQITNTIQIYKSKKKIGEILKDKPEDLIQVFNVPKDNAITVDQLEIANTNKSRDILEKNLNKQVKDGIITNDDAQQSLYVFDKVQQVSNAVKDLKITPVEKTEVANLLRKRSDLKTQIEGKEDILVVKEKQEIDEINKKIQDIILSSKPEEVATEAIPGLEQELREAFNYDYYENKLNSEYDWEVNSSKEFLSDPKAYLENNVKLFKDALQREPDNQSYKDSLDYNEGQLAKWNEINNKYKNKKNAVQEQATDESVLRTGEPQMGLQEVGEGNVQPEVVTAGTESQVLTNEEQERKVALENAFETPNTEDNTITIGEEVIPIENAQAELDALRSREVTSMEKQFGKEFPTAPTTDQGVSVTNKSAVDDIKTKTTDKGRVKVIEAAQRVLKTLKSVLPNFDIVLHNDEGSYNAAMESLGGGVGTRGNFAIYEDGSGRIDINLSRANSRTVAHEVAHAVMAKAFNGTPALYKGFRDRISKVLNESSNKKLMDFAKNYTGDVTYEEYLAELTAMLEQEEANLSVNTLQKIAAIINEIVSKITNGIFKPFEDIKDTKQVVDFFKNISESIRKGEEISPSDIEAIQEGLSLPIGSPTTITKSQKGGNLTFTKEPLPLSFVTEADKIDINKLIDEIIEKKQNVWFWMADQLGRGNYYDAVIGNDHYLDAGPSFALDPKNRSKNILWASGLPDKTLQSQIDKADYIFFISGSPEKAKLFNRRVLDLIANRINKTSDFNSFKDAMNNFKTETNELKDIKDALVKINSFDELAKSPKRKSFLIAIDNVGKNKTTPKGSLKELLGSFNAFIDYNELRDGFYKENDFTQNDIMLVGKPTGLGGSAPHSTYETAILGEVVGVPDTKINSWNIMPQALRDKYQSVIGGRETKTKAMQAKVIAAETGVVRGLEAQPTEVKAEAKPTEVSSKTRKPKSKSQLIGSNAKLSATVKFNLNLAEEMANNKMSAKDIRLATGWEKGIDGKWRYDIPDGKFKDLDINDLRREVESDGTVVESAKLSDVFDAPDLYEAYPEAKDIKVVFKKLPERNYGSFNIRDNKITVNKDLYNNKRPEADLTMLHEIQHYIQNVELFERGANQSYTPIMMKYIVKDFKNKVDIQKEKYDNVKRFYPDNKQAIKDARELYKFTKDRYAKVKELTFDKKEKKLKQAVKDMGKEVGRDLSVNDVFKRKAADAYNLYYRVAGEVEARNVEYRNKLTPEERRKTLLSETENIDREDQIMFDNSELMFTEEVKKMEKKFPISKSQVEAYHGAPHEFDKFSTSKIGTGEGNQAFGWGLYFSTLKNIAQYYANALAAPSRLVLDGMPLKEFLKKKGEEKNYRNATEDGNPNLDFWIKELIYGVEEANTKAEALKNIGDKRKEVEDNIEYVNQKIKDKEFLDAADIKMTESSARGLNRLLQDLNFLYDSINEVKEYNAKPTKFVYQVSLHEGKKPNEYTWLEWDKPIKKDVRDRILERFIQENDISKKDLNKLIEDGIQYAETQDAFDIFDAMGMPINKGMVIKTLLDEEGGSNGIRIYDTLRNAFGNDQQKASEFLLRAGVDGVKYPAESVSRGATSEDAKGFNYVVFDENAVTIKTVSKSQQDATNVVNKIVKDARAQGFSEESIRLFLESKGLDANDIKAAMQPEIPASKKATVTETMLAGFDTLMNKIDALINKNTADKDVISFLKNDKAYTNATDIQKDDMVRQVRAKLGLKQKSAPTADRLLGAIKNLAKITMTEKQALVKQIKDLSRGAKDAKKAITEAYKQLSKEIKTLATEGKLTVNQAANVLRAFSKVNVLSQTSVNRFTDYMTKVFANAEYASKLTTAKSLRRDISKLSKNKEKNANLRDLAQKFAKINPSMVEDIDAYNDMASKIKETTKGSTIRLEKVTFAETVNIENASKYIDEMIKAQDEMIRQERIAEIQDLMGIDASDFSAEDMLALLESEKPITKYNEDIVREAINKMFNIYSTLINETIKQGRDPFTDEEVNFTIAQKDVVKRFMAMDLSLLTPKEALQAVDALANFLQNSSTARMESVLSKYTGNLNAQKIVDKGIVASPLMKYWSESFGRFLAEQTTNLNILFEKMFKGFNRGGMVEDASGVTKLKNNKSMAEREANNIVDRYVSQFYKRQANGEAYNTEYNSVERGLTAFMMRNVIGTEAEMRIEFNRRKRLIEESIKVLSEGSEKEKTKSELYQKIYDKILKDSKSIQEVKDKTDPTNLEGIEYWNKEWADKYEQLSDVSLNVYNKVLDKDLNYTPDRFVKLESETGNVELDNEESAFHNNNGTIYKKETGVLMTAVKPETLPTNIDNGETNMYIDLSFDKNNANSIYDALVDINTAAPIRQIQAFLNSPNFKKIVPESKDAKLLKERIGLYVRNIRNKNPYSNDELSSAVRKLNKIASIGVGQALGGILQPVKQMVPVAMNTIINAGGLDVNAIFDSAKNSFINRSGYAISNRGIESQAQVESLNKLIDEASKTTGDKMFKAIEELNRKWLDIFLVKPDVAIARASWITYYEQSLKKQGIDTKGIDYNTHEVNEEAADYAQRMVDRQQNVSDADLAGKLFANKEATNQLFVKMLMPFASFRMNQAARVGADLGTLGNKESTVEDKKIAIKSIGGFAVEMVVFKMIAAGSAILLGTLAKMAMGKDEDDEEFKKRVNNVVKGQATGTFTDLFSPLPIADKLVQMGGNALIGVVQDAMKVPQEDQYNIFRVGKQDAIQGLGLFGIAADRATQLYEISKLASTGNYTDDFGKEKKISEKDQKALGYLIGPALLTNVGLAPVEVNSIIRTSIKDSKKATKTPEEKKLELESAANKLEKKEIKISALEYLKKRATSQQMYNTIQQKLNEINATGEEKDKIEERNKEEKILKAELLTDPRTGEKYENESKMKRYNPSLYNRNFGIRSAWYRSHKIEEAVDKKVNEVILKIEDRERRFKKP